MKKEMVSQESEFRVKVAVRVSDRMEDFDHFYLFLSIRFDPF